jgi:lipoate synthase
MHVTVDGNLLPPRSLSVLERAKKSQTTKCGLYVGCGTTHAFFLENIENKA